MTEQQYLLAFVVAALVVAAILALGTMAAAGLIHGRGKGRGGAEGHPPDRDEPSGRRDEPAERID